MPMHNPFKRHSKKAGDNPAGNAESTERRAPHGVSSTNEHLASQDSRVDILSSDVKEHLASDPQATSPPAYASTTTPAAAQAQSQRQPQPPPTYRVLKPDPFDPHGQAYGYQYAENEQNYPHPSSVAKDIGKPMEKYDDPKAAEIARRASEGGREDMTEMMNYFLRQQQLGKKSVDNGIAAWNGV